MLNTSCNELVSNITNHFSFTIFNVFPSILIFNDSLGLNGNALSVTNGTREVYAVTRTYLVDLDFCLINHVCTNVCKKVYKNLYTYYGIYYSMTTNSRQEKGKQIALKSDLIRVSDYQYRVHSQTSKRTYDVIKVGSNWTCNCADHIFRKVHCKHIHAIEFSLQVREEVRKDNAIIIEPVNCSRCVRCASDKIVKHGIRHNKRGDIQRFSCKNCHKRFTINLGFEKMRATPQVITSAMQLYFTGESLRSVQKFIRLQGVKVSHQTIYNWIQKYTNLMKKYIEQITPQVGDAWRADEVYTKVRGEMKYLFALIDDETRYWIAKEVADRKEGHDASGLFRQAKEIAGTKPKVIITDGLHSYAEAYRKEF